jgi:uncharacterized protein (TIGR03083 family)
MSVREMTEVIGLTNTEASQLRDFMAGLDQEEWAKPSACTGWTVGDVFAHLTQGAHTWSDSIARAVAGDANPPPGQQPLRPGDRGSEVTAQRAIAYRQDAGEEGLLQAFADGYHRLHQVLLGLKPQDWDKRCFHRRGIMPVHDYVGIRLQELTVHGWDIRSAFDSSAELSQDPLPVLVGLVPRWLSNTFSREPRLSSPVRYRFGVSGPVPVEQDVLVSQYSFQIEPVTGTRADVTFRCNTGNYILLIYGRLDLDCALDTGRLEVEGDRELASLFNTRFRGV